MVHDEAEGVAARATAEAVVELLVRADAEGGGLFLVERAAGGVVLAGLFHLQARADNIDDVGAVQKVVNKALGNQPGHGVLVITARKNWTNAKVSKVGCSRRNGCAFDHLSSA